MKQQLVGSNVELRALERSVITSAQVTIERLKKMLEKDSGLPALAALKFSRVGCDPLDPARSLNLIEQVNQSFTYIASIEATRRLLLDHPSHAPFKLNLGTTAGPDIISEDGLVVAETFAATHPDSNRKLEKDVAKVRMQKAKHRYVFFLSPVPARRTTFDEVTVIGLDHDCLVGTAHTSI